MGLAHSPDLERQERVAEVRASLDAGAGYASSVLITETGEGKTEYDLLRGTWNSYETHWHTAQTAFGLLEAYRVLGDITYLHAAIRAGDWWVTTELLPPHPLAGLVRAVHGDHVGELINMTTITDGTNAMFALSRLTGDAKYAEVASRSGDWFLANAYVPDEGLFYNIVDPGSGEIWYDRSPHYRDIAPSEIKITQVARPNSEGYLFADMCRFRVDPTFCDVFLDVAEKKIAWQSVSGAWMDFEPNNIETGQVHPRMNVWYAEAQLMAYALTGDQQFLDSALQAGRLMARLQQPDGSFYRRLFEDGRTIPGGFVGSASAYSGLLWLRLRDYGVTGEFDENIERSAEWLMANQSPMDHPDPNLRGSFPNIWVRNEGSRTFVYQRDIGTAFALRFLAAYYRDLNGYNVNDDTISWRPQN